MATDHRFADEGVVLTTGEIISYDEFFRRQDERRGSLLAAVMYAIESEFHQTEMADIARVVIDLVRDHDRRS